MVAARGEVQVSRSRRAATTFALGLALAYLAPSFAADRRGVLVCYPRAPGTTEQARPIMERLGAWLTDHTGQPLLPIYFNAVEPARAWLDREHPPYAILSLPLFLAWKDELGLVAVAQTERGGQSTERYHLIVPDASPWRTLADVRAGVTGRKAVVWSSHLDDVRFVSRVVFAGGLRVAADDAADVRGVATDQPLRALRKMKAGEPLDGQPVDAVLLEDTAWSELQKLATFRGALRAVFTSAPLPTPPVVAIGVEPQDVERLRQVLTTMHDEPEGRELLGTLQLTGFAAPSTDGLAAAAEAYARETP
jgi:hypothetical protein